MFQFHKTAFIVLLSLLLVLAQPGYHVNGDWSAIDFSSVLPQAPPSARISNIQDLLSRFSAARSARVTRAPLTGDSASSQAEVTVTLTVNPFQLPSSSSPTVANHASSVTRTPSVSTEGPSRATSSPSAVTASPTTSEPTLATSPPSGVSCVPLWKRYRGVGDCCPGAEVVKRDCNGKYEQCRPSGDPCPTASGWQCVCSPSRKAEPAEDWPDCSAAGVLVVKSDGTVDVSLVPRDVIGRPVLKVYRHCVGSPRSRQLAQRVLDPVNATLTLSVSPNLEGCTTMAYIQCPDSLHYELMDHTSDSFTSNGDGDSPSGVDIATFVYCNIFLAVILSVLVYVAVRRRRLAAEEYKSHTAAALSGILLGQNGGVQACHVGLSVALAAFTASDGGLAECSFAVEPHKASVGGDLFQRASITVSQCEDLCCDTYACVGFEFADNHTSSWGGCELHQSCCFLKNSLFGLSEATTSHVYKVARLSESRSPTAFIERTYGIDDCTESDDGMECETNYDAEVHVRDHDVVSFFLRHEESNAVADTDFTFFVHGAAGFPDGHTWYKTRSHEAFSVLEQDIWYDVAGGVTYCHDKTLSSSAVVPIDPECGTRILLPVVIEHSGGTFVLPSTAEVRSLSAPPFSTVFVRGVEYLDLTDYFGIPAGVPAALLDAIRNSFKAFVSLGPASWAGDANQYQSLDDVRFCTAVIHWLLDSDLITSVKTKYSGEVGVSSQYHPVVIGSACPESYDKGITGACELVAVSPGMPTSVTFGDGRRVSVKISVQDLATERHDVRTFYGTSCSEALGCFTGWHLPKSSRGEPPTRFSTAPSHDCESGFVMSLDRSKLGLDSTSIHSISNDPWRTIREDAVDSCASFHGRSYCTYKLAFDPSRVLTERFPNGVLIKFETNHKFGSVVTIVDPNITEAEVSGYYGSTMKLANLTICAKSDKSAGPATLSLAPESEVTCDVGNDGLRVQLLTVARCFDVLCSFQVGHGVFNLTLTGVGGGRKDTHLVSVNLKHASDFDGDEGMVSEGGAEHSPVQVHKDLFGIDLSSVDDAADLISGVPSFLSGMGKTWSAIVAYATYALVGIGLCVALRFLYLCMKKDKNTPMAHGLAVLTAPGDGSVFETAHPSMPSPHAEMSPLVSKGDSSPMQRRGTPTLDSDPPDLEDEEGSSVKKPKKKRGGARHKKTSVVKE